MLEMSALITLIEQCAPNVPTKPLIAAARNASGFEPLVLATRQNGRTLTVQAMSRPEAIALASEMKVAGQPVRLGLLGIDAREFERRGLPLGEAFDSCTSLRVAGELLAENAKALTGEPSRATRSPSPSIGAAHKGAEEAAPPDASVLSRSSADPPPPRNWDVYAQARARAALVYGGGK
jgi:type IV secretion system protein VirB1